MIKILYDKENGKLLGATDAVVDNFVDLTEEQYKTFLASPDSMVVKNGTIVDISQTPEYIEELEKKEKIRIANLRMTPRDFLLALTSLGVKFEDIEALLAENAQARLELNYCQYVYRGNALLDSLCGTLGVTPEQLDELFEKGLEY